ncbi:hypothetical protein ACM26V_04700 [Salipaludibacillus sp. HK11]|uniref:hypothetical protein n=1 Tax=Salipaludibacillus sp. HK11 TaxID=3394320 RepID=UPI0039FD1C8F
MLDTILDMFVKWLIIFVTLIVVIGIPAYLVYILSHKNNTLADKVESLDMRVKELEKIIHVVRNDGDT